MIAYRSDLRPALEQARELYRASSLGERRPIDDDARFAAMLANANLVVTAWDGELLVGIARALSDFSYATYLSDLAVRASHQRRGIGRELIRRTRAAAPQASLILLAAPAAERYYPHIGFQHHPQAWLLREGDALA
ncbi:MAG: GNAT family N-acetyltransferase [Rhodanobacteraceae bacterium]|jgi:predicted N-acetyltransferase YhbS|nr:GNAT family N-acetyltransferase [Rhodanobacteraceae bacterium]